MNLGRAGGTLPGAHSADDVALRGQVAFFLDNRTHALAGLAMSVPVMVGLVWPRIDEPRPLLLWAAFHAVTVVITAITFYVPFRVETLHRFPRTAVAAVTFSLAVASSTIFVVGRYSDDLSVVLGVAAVMYAVAAGSAITVGPIKPLARLTLVGCIGPLAIGAAFHGHWVLAGASAYFLGVVALPRIGSTMEWFEELTMLRDQSAKREQEAHRAAMTDSLTGLMNRQGLVEATSCRFESTVTGLFIDLDGFKKVNDRLGHLAGDELLIIVASLLQGQFRNADVVARLGGDEFFVVLTGVSRSQALELAERVVSAIRQPAVIGGQIAEVSASVGVACIDGHAFDLESLIHSADRALYEAKRAGRNRAVIA